MIEHSRAKLDHWPYHTGNWGRWDNDRGTLNLITPEVVIRAAREVRIGRAIPCSRPLSGLEVSPSPAAPDRLAAEHQMTKADCEGFEEGDLTQAAEDELRFKIHGMTNTHLDALSHMGYRGKAFNGYKFPEVVDMKDGAKRLDIRTSLAIVTRAVFIDVPRSRGVEHLELGESVQRSDVDPMLSTIEPGDAVIIRTGSILTSGKPSKGETWHHGTWTGLDTDVVEALATRDICLLGTDSPGDTYPHRHEAYCRSPIHVLSEVFFGMPLLHNLDTEELSKVCHEYGRNSFMLTIGCLNVPNATGMVVTPAAVL